MTILSFIFALGVWATVSVVSAQENTQENVQKSVQEHVLAPVGLMTDLLTDTETVFQDGFPVNVTLENLNPAENQWAEIRTLNPSFSWIVRDGRRNVIQTAYQIQIAENRELNPVLADTGKVESAQSVSVFWSKNGENSVGELKLRENGVYYWRVRTWNNGVVSPWSDVKGFRVGNGLKPEDVSRYPIRKVVETPIKTADVTENAGKTENETGNKPENAEKAGKTTFYDFGKAAFGQIRFTATAERDGKILVRLGERVKDGRVDRKPAGTTRYWQYEVAVKAGTHDYQIQTRRDKRNSSWIAVLVPEYIGEVMPFRYAEVEEVDTPVVMESVERLSAYYHFDEAQSAFWSSSDALNQVWELCKYSIKATSFLGIYIDGDRERIPYEGDALLNQLSHYGVDREYSMARYSWEYLIFHPTWPTEWNLQCCQMAWYDYLYTGDTRGIAQFYEELKKKSMITLAEENGLISTRTGKVTPEFLKSIHLTTGPQFRDIVDWPHRGLAGNENADSGETDGFVFQDYNSVVNAYHFFALNSMYHFAEILGKKEEAEFWAQKVEQVRRAYQEVFFDLERGVYRDGEATDHASLHANIFPMAFGLVPEEARRSVGDFIKSRGMRCSVYGAQFLLEAVYNSLDGQYGLERMTAEDLRGWLNMIRVGSTISLEAWDDRYKPNQDWNHAWGAAPANIIPRKLVGVEPLEKGCAHVRIHPQPGDLTAFSATVPTIRGNVLVKWKKMEKTSENAENVRLNVTIPANMTAKVYVPTLTEVQGSATLLSNGEKFDAEFWNGFFILESVGSGEWEFVVTE
ncbi:MAG: family 78 glycoside hydrolase catalytic domain [Planctomycetia bacterium]|nr:family 78 glycoside hydrolase catalytic domain [Planctomycetia bacterium]